MVLPGRFETGVVMYLFVLAGLAVQAGLFVYLPGLVARPDPRRFPCPPS